MSVTHRMNHIFRPDGRTFILAMDHGSNFNVLPALKNPGRIIRECALAGTDAFLATPGLAEKFASEFLGRGIIMRIDGGVSFLVRESTPLQTVIEPEDALVSGADAIVTMSFPGSKFEGENLAAAAKNIRKAHRFGLPVMVEALPRGFEGGEDSRTPQNIIFACRQAAEFGADIIKTEYTGSVETMKELAESVYAPVVILGGAKKIPERDLLQEVRDALDAGAAGVAMGRNIWGRENPARFTAAVVNLIHGDCSVDAALKELNQIF